MATITTQFNLIDRMTAPMQSVISSVEQTISALQNVDSAIDSGFDTRAIDDARRAVDLAQIQFEQMQPEILNNKNAVDKFNNSASAGVGIAQKLFSAVSVLGMGLAVKQMGNLMYDAATQLEATEAKFHTVFAGFEDRSQQIVDDFQKLTPATESATRSMTSGIQDLLVPMGFTRDAATDLTSETMTLTGALTNFNSATHGAEDVVGAFQSALTGEYQSLKALGIQISATTIQEKVLEMGLASATSEINSQMQAQAMLTLAYEQSGDALAAYNEDSLDTLTRAGLLKAAFTDTFAEAGQSMLPKLNEAFTKLQKHMPTITTLIYKVADGFSFFVNTAVTGMDLLLNMTSSLVENWSIIEPLVWGLVVAFGAYNGVLFTNTVLTNTSIGLTKALAAAKTFLAIGCGVLSGSTAAATAAQFAYNSALLACPLTWVLILVIALIAGFYAWVAIVNKVAGTTLSATGMMCGGFLMMGAMVSNVFLGVANFFIGIIIDLYNVWADFMNFFGNGWRSPCDFAVKALSSMADMAYSVVENVAKALDLVFGSNMASKITSFRQDLADLTTALIGEDVVIVENLNASDYQWKGLDHDKAYDIGYNWGAGFGTADGVVDYGLSDISVGGTALDEIASNTGDIADSVSISSEDMAYMRDMAEREAVNRFTTAEIKVDFGGITQNVSSNADVDGIIDYMVGKVEEAIVVTAEGVAA